MITKFKIFESYEKYKFSDEYKDKFFLPPVLYKKGDFYIVLVDEILLKDNSGTKPDTPYWPKGDCFTYVNGKFKDPASYGLSYTKEEFEKIHFMTAEEFEKEHPELVIKLYKYVNNTLLSGKWADWYHKMLKNYKRVLEKIPHIENSIKYNL